MYPEFDNHEPPEEGPGAIVIFAAAAIMAVILGFVGALGWTFGASAGANHAIKLCYQEDSQ